jgi:hypothetical protein
MMKKMKKKKEASFYLKKSSLITSNFIKNYAPKYSKIMILSLVKKAPFFTQKFLKDSFWKRLIIKEKSLKENTKFYLFFFFKQKY